MVSRVQQHGGQLCWLFATSFAAQAAAHAPQHAAAAAAAAAAFACELHQVHLLLLLPLHCVKLKQQAIPYFTAASAFNLLAGAHLRLSRTLPCSHSLNILASP
jgi:hypothetical protein